MKKKLKKIVAPVLLAVVFIGFFIGFTKDMMDDSAMSMVDSYIDELADHDMKTIKDFVSDRWSTMEGVYDEIKLRNFESIGELKSEINIKAYVKEFDRIYLIDDEGRLYSDAHTVYSKDENEFLSFLDEDKEWIACRYDDKLKFSEYQKEYMLYGYRFPDNPIVVGDTKIVSMVVLNDVSKIRGRMRITSFDERGYASVIDTDGQYIVTEANVSSLNQFRNFFDMIRNCETEGATVEEIIEKVQSKEKISFWYTNDQGMRKWVSVEPIDGLDWVFITALEESVITNQAGQFVSMVSVIIVLLIIVLVVIALIAYFAMKKLKNFYASVIPGVFNRQYYNDKLEKERAEAFVIVDLDHLKYVNDTFGHLAGDQAIANTAQVLFQYGGFDASVCRFGGDEFIVVFQKPVEEGVFLRICENMLEGIRESKVENYPELKLTFSIGAYYGAGAADELFKEADMLLYQAKKSRNCMVTNLTVTECRKGE